uniref:Putative adenylate kinase n=1 Tax=Moniliophthora roreri TaxID=221103 RepID=A0A0W0FLM3_MONRR
MQSIRVSRSARVQGIKPRNPSTPRILSVDRVRSISSTAPTLKPQPFFVNTLRAAAQETREHDEARRGNMLRMLVFGKPGAGKGTLSARLVKKYDIVVTSKLDHLHNKHWILDGFPRTLPQGELLDAHLKKQGTPLSLVVNIEVPDEIILSRISDRWVHLPSGRVYNMSYNRPKIDGFDDETGEPLTKRPDDNPEIFARRLQKFYSTTSPLIQYYINQAQKRVPSPPHRNPHQHPHQLAFPVKPPHRLLLETLTGKTSDEIWPKLEAAVTRAFPGIKERAESVEQRRRYSLSDALMSETRPSLRALRTTRV